MNGVAEALASELQRPWRVLAVDDDPTQRLLVAEVLAPPRFVSCVVASGAEALAVAQTQPFDVVLLDRQMPGLSGDDTCRQLHALPGLARLPVLMASGSAAAADLAASLQAGALDVIRKPYLPLELQARVRSAAAHKRAADQVDQAEALLFALARLVESRHTLIGDHCSRLAHLAVALGRTLGLPAADLLTLRRGGVLHDIGQLGLPDALLMKPTALDPHEWALMRRHPEIGAALLAGLPSLREALPIVRHHHERWDGGGYPDGLAGERIPLLARVFQVVDIYDALVCARPYKPPFSPEQALQLLQAEADRGWRDPAVVRAFCALARRQPERLQVPEGPCPAGGAGPAADLGRALFQRLAEPAAAALAPDAGVC